MELFRATNDQKLLKYAFAWGEANEWKLAGEQHSETPNIAGPKPIKPRGPDDADKSDFDLTVALKYGCFVHCFLRIVHMLQHNTIFTKILFASEICAATYAELYAYDPNPIYLQDALRVLGAQINGSKTNYWSWIDAIHMAMNAYSRIGNATKDPRYIAHQL